MKSTITAFLLLALVVVSCKKDASTQSGNGSLIYRASYEYPLEIRPVVFMDRLVLENVSPYSEIMGQIITTANEATSNGKPVKNSEIKVSNIHASSAVVNIVNQQAFMEDHLIDSKIVFKHMSTETTIATFSSYSNSKINYTLSNADLTAIFKNASADSFYIHFEFDSNAAPDNIKVYYDLAFDYDYTMKQYSK